MTSLKDIRLAVFGPGLLGGSLLYDARALGARELRVWARREESLHAVQRAGLADFISTDAAGVATGADILVLCMPIGSMKPLAQQLIAARPAPDAIFTDVGSVKGMVMRDVAPVFTEAGLTFIGSHPMAGSERTGFAAARPELYRDAACILTPLSSTPRPVVERLSAFWQSLGCRIYELDAGLHDNVVASISHLPHAAAVITTLTALQPDPAVAEFAAGGLRDTTRVASGDPAMWCEILMENRDELLTTLEDFRKVTARFMAALETRDTAVLRTMLTEAQRIRATRYP